jgi:hypothetical protein
VLQAEISYAEIVGGRLRTPSWRSLKTNPKKYGATEATSRVQCEPSGLARASGRMMLE